MVPCHIDGFFAQGIGHGGIHLFLHGQIDDFDHVLESSFPTQSTGTDAKGGRFPVFFVMGDLFRFHQAQVDQIDGPVLEQCFFDFLDRMQFEIDPGYLPGHLQGIFHTGSIAHHQRPAGFIQFRVMECLDGDFRTIAKGISHGNGYDRFVFHLVSSFLSAKFFQQLEQQIRRAEPAGFGNQGLLFPVDPHIGQDGPGE